uniref:Uncharacterized protein n=1 Tax=viral metagenome TaxID=1070528 RepID=A0A6M3KIA8_9ZZZZ
MKIILNREETLACIIALQKEKTYGWRDDALKKLEKAMGYILSGEKGE